jgi:hypothetical protein
MMISSGKGRRTGLRATAIALLSLAALLTASSLAIAKVGNNFNVASSGPGKRAAVGELFRARGNGQAGLRHKTHRGKRAHKHPRKGSQPGGSSSSSGSSPGKGGVSNPPRSKSGPPSTPPATPPTTSPPAGPPANETPPAPPAATPPPAACTTTVSSVASAQSAISGGAPGTVACLTDGSYGKVSLSGLKSGVTLRAANPGGATIDGASISGSGITLAYFDVTDEVVVQEGSKEITIQDNKITGGYFGIDACDSDSTTCDDVKIVGNKLEGPYGEDGIRANRYHDGDGDGLGLLIEGNEFTGIRENGNHSDCLQSVWTGDHLVFRKNYLHDNRCQGFFVKDQDDLCGAGSSGVCGPVEGIRVEDNLFLRNQEPCAATAPGCGQPVILHIFGPYMGAVISHNTIWGDGMTSLIGLREGVAPGTKLEANAIYRIWTDTDATPASLVDNTYCLLEGSWPSSRPGSTVECSPPFANTAADDYRLPSGRGVDWAPAEQHYGP